MSSESVMSRPNALQRNCVNETPTDGFNVYFQKNNLHVVITPVFLSPHSGTGVYYQAMPAVGPDGKNVMKLIPVKKVNGHFVHTQLPPSRTVGPPAHTSPAPSVPTLQPTADGRFILKTPLEVNKVINSVKSQQRGPNALQSSSNQVHVPLITHNVAQNTLPPPVQPNNKALIVTNSPQLPNTVKLPALQSGHYLKIPPNATVRTVPASALPASIKNQICCAANDSKPIKGLPMVLYVSPVSSLKLNQNAPCLTNPSELPQTVGPTSTASVMKSPVESPRSNQGGTTPMKWVVEERAGNSAPFLIPVTSPNMSSDILKAVKHMESARFPNQVPKGPVSADISKVAVTPGNNNALVMCNGKVYFVAKRNSEVTKDMIINTESKVQPKKPAQSPTTAIGPATSNVSQKQDQNSPVNSKKPSNIIDLCDDEESSTCTSSGRKMIPSDAVSERDEDSNVIFVSYIPPKSSETETSKEVTETTSQTSYVKDTDNTKLDTESMETGCEVTSDCSLEVDASKCEAVHVNGAALEGNEALSEKLEVICDQQTDVTEKQTLEETIPEKIHQRKSDSELRRTFGITADLSVPLQKIDVSKEPHSQEVHPQKRLFNKRAIDGIRKRIRDSKIETKIKQLIQTQMQKNGKRKRLETNEGKNGSDTLSLIDTDSPTQSNGLVECDYELQSALAEQSTDRQVFQTCQAAEDETPSTSGAHKVSDLTNNLLFSLVESVQAQGDGPDCCSGLRKTPPRSSKGCGRVCTACPCGTKVGGVAGNSACKPREKPNTFSSVNSSKSVSSESNRDMAPADEIMSDTVSSSTNFNSALGSVGQAAMMETCSSSSRCTKDKICNKSKSSQLETGTWKPNKLDKETISSSVQKLCYTSVSYTIPSELYSSVTLDPEEIKRQERIKRLKDLLQEKEAALERLRKSM